MQFTSAAVIPFFFFQFFLFSGPAIFSKLYSWASLSMLAFFGKIYQIVLFKLASFTLDLSYLEVLFLYGTPFEEEITCLPVKTKVPLMNSSYYGGKVS